VTAIPEQDLYLWNHGNLRRAWNVLGAHPVEGGVRFALWAPFAKSVAVSGSFCDWDDDGIALTERGTTGVWLGVVENARVGDLYKYALIDSLGEKRWKSDPFAFAMELRPKTASVVQPLAGYSWGDGEWMAEREQRQRPDRPMSIYEVHLGSWRRDLGYRDLADQLVDYVAEMGFTHVEFLPLAEHPYDPSWGYQICGYYAPTSRYGSPDELRALVDAFHRRGIGVLMDWVPAHFPKDDHGLARFDGSHLYEHQDPRRGEHRDWETLIFNYGRNEVRNFLISNALYWIEEFHLDGLRVDAVASMLYLDYSREEGEWIPNEAGGNEDLEAIEFLKEFNRVMHEEAPGALMIAEESTAFPGVTQTLEAGGLGFDLKWNMGWMHDSLAYLEKDPIYRKFHHDRLTFALYYAFHENYLLPLSHDEVVHLKKSLLEKMPGDEWRKLANLRLLLAWQTTHPGKTLLFMGAEFGVTREWDHDGELDWAQLRDPGHAGLRLLVGDLNKLVRDEAALHECDHDWRGFAWIDYGDVENSSVSFVRYGARKKDGLLIVFNFTPIVRSEYRVGVPRPGEYVEVLNTDAACYGGSGVGNLGSIQSEPVERHDQADSLLLTLPPLGVVAFRMPAVAPVRDAPEEARARAAKPEKPTRAEKPARKPEA